MKKLLVYGDSFAGPPTRYDLNAYGWVDLLAAKLKIPYHNKAVAGSSLQYTMSVFIKDYLEEKIEDGDIIVFTLTDPSRLHLDRQNKFPKTATRYISENNENKKDYWYQINKNYLKWYFLNKDTELDYINASSYIHLLYGYAKNNPKIKIVLLKSFPNNYYISIADDISNFIFPSLDLKTASDGEFNKLFSYKDWEKPFGTDIRSNHFSNPNLKILAESIVKALVHNDASQITYDNFLKEIFDKPILSISDYKKYIDIGYLFYSKNMWDRLNHGP